MSGSESKSEQETDGSSPSESDRSSLVDFLAPPRSRSSVPAPQPAAANAADVAASTPEPTPETSEPTPEKATSDPTASEVTTPAVAADATTPTTPTTPATAPEPALSAAVRAADARPSQAPLSISDAGARSLIPVATSSTSAASEEDTDDDFDVVPGAPWSGRNLRRATFVALLAAAAAVPAWVVLRNRTSNVQARAEVSAEKIAAAAPGTLQPARVIEADDESEPAETPPVPVDPAQALELRREARRLLEAGQVDQGVATARRAIAANPADPECYVLLAAGLQDMGRWAESREVFSRCVHKSNNTINAECVYFATSGTITNR